MSRFIIYGAGAVGGVLGACLHRHGEEVILVARGAHYEAIRDDGLSFAADGSVSRLQIPIVDRAESIDFRADDVVFVGVKSQDTDRALTALASAAPRGISVACLQNGVANERVALRLFPNVYGVWVNSPTGHLTPGLVEAFRGPEVGRLDIGRYPEGKDDTADMISAVLRESSYRSNVRTDIMRWKYRKLLVSIGSGVKALCGPHDDNAKIVAVLRREAESVLDAAGIAHASYADYAACTEFLELGTLPSTSGSSSQSLRRQTGAVEADYTNGEIVLLGRFHGVPTPANELMQQLMREAATQQRLPGDVPLARLRDQFASIAASS